MTASIEAVNLGKRFGAVQALNGLSLSIPQGGVYGVLGVNGAGKSTFFRLCLDLIRPSSGQLRLFGARAGSDAVLSRRIGSMIETPRFHPYLTAEETLAWLARASGVSGAKIAFWLERVGLKDAAKRRVQHFSVGMKQRLGIAAALIAEPELVILDEPTSGMDPAGIQEIRALIRALAERDGKTVVLASHLLDEVQRTCDRIAILDHGSLAAEGRIEDLMAGRDYLRLLATPIDAALNLLGAKAVREGHYLRVTIAREETPACLRALIEGGVAITEARWMGGELEKFFLEQTGAPRAE